MSPCCTFTGKSIFATAVLGMALCVLPAAAGNADERVVPCPLPVPAAPPEPTRCARLAEEAMVRHGPVRIDALIEASRQAVTHARFEQAERALDCAGALLPPTPDKELQRRLLRAHGRLDYARERMPEALGRLQCALEISSAGDDRDAESSDLNAIGSALRRLGDYRGALAALTRSLRMRREGGGDTGAVLNNIADVYRELGEREEAMRHYRDALAAFRDAGDAGHAAHVLESMAVVVLEDGNPAQARTWLEEALARYRSERRLDFELRVHGWLVRAALAEGDTGAARRWSASGQALATEHRLAMPASFALQAARTERLSGEPVAAAARLRGFLSHSPGAPSSASGEELAQLYTELAAAQEASGDAIGAIATLRRAREEADAFARAAHDRQLGWLRTRFETVERDRTIARLESDNRLRRLQLALFVALAAAAMLGGWLWLQRRRQREREAEAARLARKEEELARYRREAGALAEDRQLLQGMLDSREEALCLLDAEAQVLAANSAACRVLGAQSSGLVGHGFVDALDPGQRAALSAALEHIEDAASAQSLSLVGTNGHAITARLSPWAQGDGPILLELRAAADAALEAVPHAAADPQAMESGHTPGRLMEGSAQTADDDMRDAFRRALVELMLATLDSWERSTGQTRLELAEQSRIWRVAIDDGRLRARSMERYLSLSRLPQNPRWRDVLRTAYHVLENCSLDPAVRSGLQSRVDAALAFTRRSALV